MWSLDSDWYSPKSLLSSPTYYDFPGDRFIPNRSLMDLDQAKSLLTNRTKKFQNPSFDEMYRQKVEKKLTSDADGRPFRMLVFRGSPKSSRKSIRHIDEMREEEAAALQNSTNQHQIRQLPKGEARILDAPNLKNDFYLNIMDWGKNNVLGIALGSDLYLWNAENRNVIKLFQAIGSDYPTSVAWSEDSQFVAAGFMSSKLQLWDAETSKAVRSLEGHDGRIATCAWNGHILTSGSQDKSIINHDGRGNILASGGNENLLYIWDSAKMSSSNFLNCFNDHCAAVKALAWCPYQSDVLASGGGTQDGSIKLWNIQKGTCICSIDTKAQVCGLEWNRHHKEILSGHGFSTSSHQNQLCLWKYPSMINVGCLNRHASRILHLAQSPDGLTVVSAGADETLRFWDVFGPPSKEGSEMSELDNLLSLKISPIR
ncbi:cell division cycle 20.5, cofactor of APC complex-like isoform X2 [Prosopis cineraria]|uniref:cell division cycle 20.5, cofactor of APC complex-like isoform X2 n=1 Tax=Prosopis cineraria TaxID=364024 RepID=UPI00240FC7C5|nr:cell division cycle 20.5, cofactor of APC complex-like isoform X2 [Prosopis cineraria]